jgi:hypothetical protein
MISYQSLAPALLKSNRLVTFAAAENKSARLQKRKIVAEQGVSAAQCDCSGGLPVAP